MTFKKIFRGVFYTFLAIGTVLILIRVFTGVSESRFTNILPTESAKRAYRENESFQTHETTQSVSYDKKVKEYSIVYIPSEKEVQVTLKINKSFYPMVGLEKGDLLSFRIYNSETEEERDCTSFSEDEDSRYKYFRLSFGDTEVTEGADMEVIIASFDSSKDYTVIKIHSSAQKFEEYGLSKEEKELLEN